MRKIISFLIVIMGFAALSAAAAPRQDDDRGLVGYWKFDEEKGDGVKDSSGFGNGGELHLAKRVPGKVGGALSFATPGSYVKIPCSASLNLGDSISIEAWICPPDAAVDPAGNNQSRVILSKNDEYAMRIDKPAEGGHISFFVQIGSPAVTWEPRVSSTKVPTPGRWQHVVAVWDGTKSLMYIDGELVASRPRTGKPNPNPYPVMIGNWEYPACHGTNFGGLIDEVKIYNRALSAEEVKAHYDATK